MRIIDEDLLRHHPAGAFSTLRFIHTILFQDIYDFAGKIRTVNIAKNDYRFASALYLPEAVRAIEAMPHTTLREIVDKYAEMNVAHPFREGNGAPCASGWITCSLASRAWWCSGTSSVRRNTFPPCCAAP
ncbi:Fic family protein [Corynebacterium sp. 22KM0430]|uniref:Fic family protein n=1 Tax=unclassified Corynebacterium TaxID=2624378 RepID=UPI0039AF3322